jgi:polysaccharide biosynthesis transport protein
MQIIKDNHLHFLPPAPADGLEYLSSAAAGNSLSYCWDVLWAHRRLFVGTLIACLTFAALFTFSRTSVYQARGSLELQIPAALSYSSRDAQARGSVDGQTFDSYLDVQIGILESDTLIRRVITRLKLAESAPRRRWLGLATGTTDAEEVFERAKKNLVVRQSRLNNLVEVLYSAEDPQVAADFVNTLINEYEHQNLESRWQMAQDTGSWLSRHLVEIRTDLEASEKELQHYARSNGLLLVSDKDSLARQSLHHLQEALSLAQAERILRQSQMQMSAASSPESVPQVLENPALSGYGVKISELKRQLAEYQLIFTADNPKVKSIQSQIASLETASKQQQSSVLGSLRNQYTAALRNEKMLSAEYAAQVRTVTDQDEKMIRYETLKHEVDTNRATYESLLQKVKESGVSVALQATNIRIVDAAVPPSRPYKPNHLINLGCGLLAGLLLGLTSVAVHNRYHRSIHRAGVLSHYLTTRELGVIPSRASLAPPRLSLPGRRSGGVPSRDSVNPPRLSFKERLRGVIPSRAHLTPLRLSLTGRLRPVDSSDLQTWLEPDSPVSESFRSLMTSILFSTENSADSRLLVVTSPCSSEGKTTVASNLAAAFAAAGRRVLLVDADLRRPRLHTVFKLPNSPGLFEFAAEIQLRGVAAAEVDKFVQPTVVPGLFLMASGNSLTSAPSLLYTLDFKKVFSAIRGRFDMVLVDVPPLLCANEVRVMARLADGVILVVRASSSRVEEVVATERYLKEDGGTLVGTVLNDAPYDVNRYYAQYAAG